MAEFTKVASLSEVPDGEGRMVEVAGKEIALFNVGGAVYAIDNTCLHQGGPLAEGELDGTVVSCPWHGWEYELTTGANVVDGSMCVATYEVRLEGDDVLVAV